MFKLVLGSRASARRAWVGALALAGVLGGCSPSHEKPDAAESPDAGAGGGSTGHADGAAGAPEDGKDATTAEGGGGSPGTACTNACSTGTTRCVSSTTLEACTVGANGCTSFVASTCAAATVCERTMPAACVDPQWAEWPIPNSTNDVANGAPNLTALVDNLDGTVTDRVTSLMWEQRYHQSVYAVGDDFCATVMTGGYTDWRQATLIELISITDSSRDQPSIDTAAFPLASDAGFFWSGTEAVDFANEPYIINYGNFPDIRVAGGFGVDGLPGQNVRCVR
jgi:hypothetical protein